MPHEARGGTAAGAELPGHTAPGGGPLGWQEAASVLWLLLPSARRPVLLEASLWWPRPAVLPQKTPEPMGLPRTVRGSC